MLVATGCAIDPKIDVIACPKNKRRGIYRKRPPMGLWATSARSGEYLQESRAFMQSPIGGIIMTSRTWLASRDSKLDDTSTVVNGAKQCVYTSTQRTRHTLLKMDIYIGTSSVHSTGGSNSIS